MRKIKFGICAIVITVCAAANADTDGKVTFNGELVAETCSIKAGSEDITVTLPKVAIQRLAAGGQEAGSKTFNIEVEECPEGVTKVAAHFEAIANTGFDPATGNLTNTVEDSPATNVQVRLYNSDDNSQIPVGSTGHPFNIVNNAATMVYSGGYYSTAATTAGKVTAQVQYVLAYP
ncbi:fimbrial protein [Serratia inhibens]|uniref:fimbrial protein n=1 Tax=Serratia inhibens TaxID=2338073 RepID=UPI00025E39A2|nr:fimbrial protein [Serratia inhibens]ANS44534.1 Laminin-binding fimbrial subunit ElfA [Serratia inhibens PRI-2C]